MPVIIFDGSMWRGAKRSRGFSSVTLLSESGSEINSSLVNTKGGDLGPEDTLEDCAQRAWLVDGSNTTGGDLGSEDSALEDSAQKGLAGRWLDLGRKRRRDCGVTFAGDQLRKLQALAQLSLDEMDRGRCTIKHICCTGFVETTTG